MTKLLSLLLLALVLYLVFSGMIRSIAGKAKPGGAEHTPYPPQAERMVACSLCGIHIPVSEALSVGGESFCSEEHLPYHPTA